MGFVGLFSQGYSLMKLKGHVLYNSALYFPSTYCIIFTHLGKSKMA